MSLSSRTEETHGWRKNAYSTGKHRVPRPRGYPILGNIDLFMKKVPPYVALHQIGKQYGEVFMVSLAFKDVLVLNSPEVIREAFVLRKDDFSGRPHVYSIGRLSRGDGGIAFRNFSTPWVKRKNASTKAFRSKFLRYFEDTSTGMFKDVDELLNSFNMERNAFDPSGMLGVVITNIIMNITCSVRYKDGDPELEELIQANNNLKIVLKPGDIVDVFPFFKIFPNKRQLLVDQLISIREKVFMREFKRHKCSYKPENVRDFVDALLSLGMSEDEGVMTSWEMFASGFESTFQTVRWAMLYLTVNQEVQTKIQNELDENSSNQYPIWKNRCHLRYLEATVLEVLRHSSFSSLNGPHQTITDTEICGYKIPKGTMVLSNLWWVHHDPSRWTSPAEFNPDTITYPLYIVFIRIKNYKFMFVIIILFSHADRFLDSEGNIYTPPSFLPFSIGRRMCLGEQFAKMMVFTLLGAVLQRFSLAAPQGKLTTSTEPSEPDMIRVADQFEIQLIPRGNKWIS
ncbi:steroid 17-alpha-hydroxylase/17,20 lyase-like [Antedon mediterranea]|uniref:steroid 17-alpha-hydroxylase/17,20 lyase-like n=1 Tax=Antedon mediterranea TaxID=105859 RepID=UPI003AF5AB47